MNYIYVVNSNDVLTENQRQSFLDACRRWQCMYAENCQPIIEPRELKFEAFNFCPDTDKILILDADTLIRSDCPSPFIYNNAAVLSSYEELPDLYSSYDFELIFAKYPKLNISKYVNTGVLLLSDKKVLDFASEISKNVPGRVGVDQTVINYALAHFQTELTLLDWKWNYRGPEFPEPMQTYIYHFAGQGENRYEKFGHIDWFHSTIKGRSEFYKLLGNYQTGVEVGVHRGLFSETILGNWNGFLYLVDLWKQQPIEIYQSTTCNQPNNIQEQVYQEAKQRLTPYENRTMIIRNSSVNATEFIKLVDFVYIDANHSFEATLADLKNYYPLVKPGGLIAGHDFLDGLIGGCNFGVKRAVFEFLKDKPFPLYVTQEEFPTWYFYKE